MALGAKEQFQLLKGPLITTVVIVLLLAGAALAMHFLRPSHEPPVVEANSPAVSLRDLTFFKEGDEYVLYFSLADAAGNDIARAGDVSLKISQLGTIGMEGGPQFINETVLLDARFDVGLAAYRWVDIGGGFFFSQRQLILPKRIAANLFKSPPRTGLLGKITVRFRDAKVASNELYLDKRLLFP